MNRTIIQTHNTIYTLEDLGDGAFRLQGNEKYCPTPTRVELEAEPKRSPWGFLFKPLEGPHEGKWIRTSPVLSVVEEKAA